MSAKESTIRKFLSTVPFSFIMVISLLLLCSACSSVPVQYVPRYLSSYSSNIKKVASFKDNPLSIYTLAFSPDGRTVAAGGHGGAIYIWDTLTGEKQRTIQAHDCAVRALAFSPDGKVLASGGWDDLTILWDVASNKILHVLGGHTDIISAIAFSPDGKILATTSRDQQIILRNVVTGNRIMTLKGHSDYPVTLSFSPDSSLLASGDWGGKAIVWDVETGSINSILEASSQIDSVTFSPDGSLLATGETDDYVVLWDVETGEPLKRLKAANDVRSVLFSREGRVLISCDLNTICFWDTETGERISQMDGLGYDSNLLALSPDSMKFVLKVGKTEFELWDFSSLYLSNFFRKRDYETADQFDKRVEFADFPFEFPLHDGEGQYQSIKQVIGVGGESFTVVPSLYMEGMFKNYGDKIGLVQAALVERVSGRDLVLFGPPHEAMRPTAGFDATPSLADILKKDLQGGVTPRKNSDINKKKVVWFGK